MNTLNYLSKMVTIHLHAGLFSDTEDKPSIMDTYLIARAGRVCGYRHALDIIGDYPAYDNIYFAVTGDRLQRVVKEEFPCRCQRESDAKYVCTIVPKDNADGFEVTIKGRCKAYV